MIRIDEKAPNRLAPGTVMRMALASAVAVLGLAAAGVAPARATWSRLPSTGVPVSLPVAWQSSPQAVADGSGGMFVVWKDMFPEYGVTSDSIRVSHLTSTGLLDPTWPVIGVAVAATTFNSLRFSAAGTAAAGVFVTWEDRRAGASGSDIYAARVLASGTLAPGWPAGGLVVCNATSEQLVPTIVSDGGTGAVIAWQDGRAFWDVYAQHVLGSGVVDPAWPANGRALCTAADGQGSQSMASDGAGGAIVTWHDFRTHTQWDIYAQHVLANGAVDPAWPVDGRAVCTATSHQDFPMTLADGAGGAIITWDDRRSGPYGVYAQHVLASGVVDPAWPANGLAVGTAMTSAPSPTNVPYPKLVSDGAAGAIITWQDDRNAGVPVVYAQRVTAAGALAPGWPVNGTPLCGTSWTQKNPLPVADGAGGAIVCWEDGRAGAADDLYGQRITGSGALDPPWPATGRAIVIKSDLQPDSATVVSDGRHGVLVAYFTEGGAAPYHIEAARLCGSGTVGSPLAGEITAVTDVPADQGGFVTLRWLPAWNDLDPTGTANLARYSVWRQLPSLAAARAITTRSRPDGAPAMRVGTEGAATTYWEWLANVPATGLIEYASAVATVADSTPNVTPTSTYMVMGEMASSYWSSDPASGHSVDNLAPAAPAVLPSHFDGTLAHLLWTASPEPDLKGYYIHIGPTPDYSTVGWDHLVTGVSGTHYDCVVPTWPVYFKLTAVDVHGNISAPTSFTVDAAGVHPDAGAPAFALEAPSPNPASEAMRLRFRLPVAAAARLAVYDAMGREVRVLADGVMGAGGSTVAWDLRDRAGNDVPAGLYFVRLSGAGRSIVQRAVVAR